MLCPKCGQEYLDELPICPSCQGRGRQPEMPSHDYSEVGLKDAPYANTHGTHLFMVVGILILLVLSISVFGFLWYLRSPGRVLAMTQQKIGDLKSVHITMNQKIAGGDEEITVTASGDMIPPDKFHITGTMVGGGQQMTFEQILVNNKLYIRVPEIDANWTTMDVNPEDFGGLSGGAGTQLGDYLVDYLEATVAIDELGSETIRGVDCYHYNISIDESGLASDLFGGDGSSGSKKEFGKSEISIQMWIGKSDNLPYKQRIRTKSQDFTMDGTIEFSDFNKEVNIQPPPGL